MATLDDLWADYARTRRPANIGDVVDGEPIGNLDDEVQDVVSSYSGMGLDLGAWRVARLGLALAAIERILPRITPIQTREYFVRVAAVARAALEMIATSQAPT